MKAIGSPFTITGTSPAAAGNAILGSAVYGLGQWDRFLIDADLIGATGGVLDVYLQRRVKADVWLEWAHFTQVGAGGVAIRYTFNSELANTAIVAVGKFNDAGTGTAVLAANAFVGGHPGDALRVFCVAGASTSAGAALTVYITPIKTRT